MNKLAHLLILAVFGIACWFLWGILTLVSHGIPGEQLPAFSKLCVHLRSVTVVLPLLATAYCLWIWFRKAERLASWLVFFATTMSVLVLVTAPVLVAAYLPLLKAAVLNVVPK